MEEASLVRLFLCYLLATSFTTLNHDSGNSSLYANITKPISITDVKFFYTESVILSLLESPTVENQTSPESIWNDTGTCAVNLTIDISGMCADDVFVMSTANVCYLTDKTVQMCPLTDNTTANDPNLRIEATWLIEEPLNARGPAVAYGKDDRPLLTPIMVDTGYRRRTIYAAIIGALYALYVTCFTSNETILVGSKLVANFNKAHNDWMDKREISYSAKLAEANTTCNLKYLVTKMEIKYEQMGIMLRLIDKVSAVNGLTDLATVESLMERHWLHVNDRFFCQAFIDRKADSITREHREMMELESHIDMSNYMRQKDLLIKTKQNLDMVRADKTRLRDIETKLKQDMKDLVDASRGEYEEMDRELVRITKYINIWKNRAEEAAKTFDDGFYKV